jgi:hypothetical protein
LISIDSLAWRRSQRCDTGTCVEVAQTDDGVALRDSTLPGYGMLHFAVSDWKRFVADLRAGHHYSG